MTRLTISFIAILVAFLATSTIAHPIEHFVVVMLENRAFDHMLGWINQWMGPNKVDGLTGAEFNIANGTKWYVKDSCPYVNPFDPLHDLPSVTEEVMGGQQWLNPAPMDGFAKRHFEAQDADFWMVMHGFKPDMVPAISTLAENFVLFDKYFSSLPGPTYPNRMFWHSGTSHGMDANTIIDFLPGQPQRTMMDVFNDYNISWATYFSDLPDMILFKTMREWKNLENYHLIDEFSKHVKEGTLPTYSWVCPQFLPSATRGAQDQHPDHDVILGEEFIAEIYGILRNSDLWNKTAFILTYDEHGGIYDHVPPPADNIPNPDGLNTNDGFNFTRLGVRVPMIVASPWVAKGHVVGEPETSHFEHSSAYATLKRMLGLEEELTNRTAWAAPWDFIFSEAAPRTDCPTSLPTPPNPGERRSAVLKDQQARPPNGLQRELFSSLEGAIGRERTLGSNMPTQLDMHHEVKKMMEQLLTKGQ
jgi:phospholipase C